MAGHNICRRCGYLLGGTHFLSNWRHFPPTRVIKRIEENTKRESLVALLTMGPSNCTAVSYKNCIYLAIGMSNIISNVTELLGQIVFQNYATPAGI